MNTVEEYARALSEVEDRLQLIWGAKATMDQEAARLRAKYDAEHDPQDLGMSIGYLDAASLLAAAALRGGD